MNCLKNHLSDMISCSSSTQLVTSDNSQILTQDIFTEHELHSNWRNSNKRFPSKYVCCVVISESHCTKIKVTTQVAEKSMNQHQYDTPKY